MSETLRIDPAQRKLIENAVHAESHMCWTCGSCVGECPVNAATSRLHPRKIVWMANLGLLEELLRLPEIWYCLTCNRCSQVCPMTVKPSVIIAFLRLEAVARGLLSYEKLQQFKSLFCRFHRERFDVALSCAGEKSIGLEISRPLDLFSGSDILKEASQETELTSCYTCGECSSACPVCCGSEIFDPRRIFRMAGLGLGEELLSSPSIWLCISCQKCSGACSQKVLGHRMIQRLQELAVKSGYVDPEFPDRWKRSSRELYARLLDDIDSLLGFPRE